ncbi:Alpha/Beta hydrolase protein [Limtongia smithiae]|uniref:Alpha/Beta hydrolase protein n=1 Tax=Limtongia smithiae TaxID=1125753 RepID=UPI0034CFDC62
MISGIIKSVFVGFLIYLTFLTSLLFEPVQRNLVFLHRVRLGSKETLYYPENVGFALNQVAPFWLDTPDGERLFGWHLLPLDVYESHKAELRSIEVSDGVIDSGELAQNHLKILKEDPDARLIIYYHGNSGCISSIHRPDVYRALLSTSPKHTHVFVVDYRGFGMSTGQPSEDGLVTDGAFTAIEIMNRTGISPDRTILVGQSLGTGVIIGAADLLAQQTPKVEVQAIVPIAGFASIEELLSTFKLFGVLPVLSPFAVFEPLQRTLAACLRYKFHSDERMERFVRNTRKTKVLVVHSFNDQEIPFDHGEKLLDAALIGAIEAEDDDFAVKSNISRPSSHLQRLVELDENERDGVFEVVSVGIQQAREYVFYQRLWDNSTAAQISGETVEYEAVIEPVGSNDTEIRRISMLAVKWGGHNVVPKSTDVVLSIRNILYD